MKVIETTTSRTDLAARSWRGRPRGDKATPYLVTAPLSAQVNAAVGLEERSSCWRCCTRGSFCSAVGPVNTSVLTTPDTTDSHKTDTSLTRHQRQLGGGQRGGLPWLHCSSSLGNANLKENTRTNISTHVTVAVMKRVNAS